MQQPLPKLRVLQWIIELLLIAVFAVYANRNFADFDPARTLHGGEAQWLTNSALYASKSVRELGYIPHWQPYLSRGEPTIDSPFSFVLSPINMLPSLLIGYPNGIKVSILLTFILSGWGGWIIARLSGLSAPGRVIMGLLLIARGPAHGSIAMGYFQLGTTQLYIPWVIAAALALARYPERRWPVVMLALSITLLFWGGNIYYTLPAVMIGLTLIGFFAISRTDNGRLTVDTVLLRRTAMALILSGLLAAATLLPIFMNQDHIGRHPDEKGWGAYTDLRLIGEQLFNKTHLKARTDVWNENYYVYLMPPWFGLLIFLMLPLLEWLLPQPPNWLTRWRLWGAGLVSLAFFTAWGTGTNAIVGWMYDNLPLIGQWRVVGRMLTVTSLWVAIFAVLKIDAYWRAIDPIPLLFNWMRGQRERLLPTLARAVLGFGLVVTTLIAIFTVIDTRWWPGGIVPENKMMVRCIDWLHTQFPDQRLAVFTRDYYTVSAFMRHNMRMTHINADFDPLGLEPTIFPQDLTEAMPEFLIAYDQTERDHWGSRGYVPVAGSPAADIAEPCVWRNRNVLSYAFTASLDDLNQLGQRIPRYKEFPLDPAITQPITAYFWQPGYIGLKVNNTSGENQVVVIQEVAWPGWQVTVNGQPGKLESVGQLIGYVVPSDGETYNLMFEYTAPLLKLGSAITIATALFTMAYLAGLDKRLKRRKNGITSTTAA